MACRYRGKRTAIKFFEKAIEADSRDADYHFNLGLALLKAGDVSVGLKQLREALTLRPADTEIKAAIESTNPALRSMTSQPSRCSAAATCQAIDSLLRTPVTR